MEYEELEDIFDILSDRSAGIMTTRSLIAVCAGLFIGALIARLFFASFLLYLMPPLVCATLAYLLSYSYQGLTVYQRIGIAVQYGLQKRGAVLGDLPQHDYTGVVVVEDHPMVKRL